MFAEVIARKIGVALLALAVLFTTAPVATAASASSSPCDCPSMPGMSMQSQDVAERTTPAKEHGSPCSDMQNCVCGISCGAAMNLPQTFVSVVPIFVPLRARFSDASGGHGISIRPAIPPPIAHV